MRGACEQARGLPRCSWRPVGAAVRHRARTVHARCQEQPICLGQAVSSINNSVAVWKIPDSSGFPEEMRGATVLILDRSGNLHSTYREQRVLTGAYWDCLAILPALVPEGPLVILGLGAGTIAHLIHAYYPDRMMHGWELDPAVIMMAEQHMGMKLLTDSGILVVHVGDALVDSAGVGPPGAAGIIVDLFADGQLIPQLTQVSSWRSIRQRLAPGGRVVANLGAAQPSEHLQLAEKPDMQTTRAALSALAEAFEGQVTCCSLCIGNTANMIAITGPTFAEQQLLAIPADLRQYLKGWAPYAALTN